MSGQSRSDIQVDALVRRLDVEQSPPREFVDETYELVRAHAEEARRRDGSSFGRLLDTLPILARPNWQRPIAWRPAVALVLALVALLVWLALTVTGPGPGPLPRLVDHVLFGRGHAGVDGYDLWVIGRDGSDPHLLVRGSQEVSRVSSDGTLIAAPIDGPLVSTRIYRSDGTVVREVHPSGELASLNLGVVAWSHDGIWLAFEAWDETQHDRDGVYLAHADGTNLHRLTGTGVPGDFSPDDQELLITRQEGLFLVNVDGNGEHQVGTLNPVGYSSAGFMPGGTSIYAAADGKLWIVAVATQSALPIEIAGGNITTPRVSPDGRTFVFTFDATAADTTAIWVMNADGTGAHQLVDDPSVNEDFSDWLP